MPSVMVSAYQNGSQVGSMILHWHLSISNVLYKVMCAQELTKVTKQKQLDSLLQEVCVSDFVTSLPSRINDAPLTSANITCIAFNLLVVRWWVVPNCLKWPSRNSLIHFYKRCVSVPMLTSFMCRSNDTPLTSSNILYYLLGPFNQTVLLVLFSMQVHDAESTNRNYICLICGVSGFLYLVTNTL